MLTVDFNAVELSDRGPGLRAAFPISSHSAPSGKGLA